MIDINTMEKEKGKRVKGEKIEKKQKGSAHEGGCFIFLNSQIKKVIQTNTTSKLYINIITTYRSIYFLIYIVYIYSHITT